MPNQAGARAEGVPSGKGVLKSLTQGLKLKKLQKLQRKYKDQLVPQRFLSYYG